MCESQASISDIKVDEDPSSIGNLCDEEESMNTTHVVLTTQYPNKHLLTDLSSSHAVVSDSSYYNIRHDLDHGFSGMLLHRSSESDPPSSNTSSNTSTRAGVPMSLPSAAVTHKPVYMGRPRGRPPLTAQRVRARTMAPDMLRTATLKIVQFERGVCVQLFHDHLFICKASDSSDSNCMSIVDENELTFLELVQVKDSINQLIDSTCKTDNTDLLQRLRQVKSHVIGWVETRLRNEECGNKRAGSSESRRGRPSYRFKPYSRHNSSTIGSSNELSHSSASLKLNSTSLRTDCTGGFISNTDDHNMKTVQDLAILQSKFKDIDLIETELSRTVSYFQQELAKENNRVHRLKNELTLLDEQLALVNDHLSRPCVAALYSIIDKEKRRSLTSDSAAVKMCTNLLLDIGADNYTFLLSNGITLLTIREVQDKYRSTCQTQDVEAPMQPSSVTNGHLENSGVSVSGMGAGDSFTRCDDAQTGDSTLEKAVGSILEDDSDHIDLPSDVLEQVMQGKGYLVDENGERITLKILPDGNVLACNT